MKTLTVIQHTSADYLGLMEDHLEGRGIRFIYCRPFTEGVEVPNTRSVLDGLILLGGGPWNTSGARALPTLREEVLLARDCLYSGKAVIGIGLGAQILALAADGSVEQCPLTFVVDEARRVKDDALNGYMPERFPLPVYMRDWPVPPSYAEILAEDSQGRPAVFQIGDKALGFAGHPGFKRAMAEDLIMEFEDGPDDPGDMLVRLGASKPQIEDALVSIMTGVMQVTGLMKSGE
ncbi:hypothetical protein V0U79_05150 [Hyphobacterium sp. HN65]|uniref:Glutamine amidotransferase domain-containing protein n=1 Tax=Hyphobacterium lacteum TaxID=3116575 RepID=A0ABU7LPA2_9PROT|nr:hypothetical protein [Hyphobacterium sp. HN65]MEE2525745.1 hypothetical protein [Hyphobacterium sp. HN65]